MPWEGGLRAARCIPLLGLHIAKHAFDAFCAQLVRAIGGAYRLAVQLPLVVNAAVGVKDSAALVALYCRQARRTAGVRALGCTLAF